jgi:hypothetical protein
MLFKKLIHYSLILFITVIILEVLSYFSFSLFTGKKFSYSELHDVRSSRMALVNTKLGGGVESQALFVFHPYIGYVGRPGAYPWSKEKPPFNKYGMISVAGHPYPYKKAEDEFVVAVVGGSVAEIFANQAEESMNTFLRGRMGFKKKLVLINLATGGYKQPQQLFHLQYALLSGFQFDAVVNIDGFNDLVLASENITSGMNPIFPSGNRFGLLAKIQSNSIGFETSKQLYNYYRTYNRELALLSFIDSAPFNYSVFLNLFGELWVRYSMGRVGQISYDLTVETPKTLSDEFRGPDYSGATDTPYEAVTEIWQKSSEMLGAVCEKNKLLYIHVLQPNQYVKGSKPLSPEEQEVAIDPDGSWGKIAREGYGNLVTAGGELQEAGVAFYDLSMIFKDYRRPLYIDSCCHFNKEGNVLLGRSIANILLRELKER